MEIWPGINSDKISFIGFVESQMHASKKVCSWFASQKSELVK